MVGTGWQALPSFLEEAAATQSPQGQSKEAGSPAPSPGQRSPPWLFPPHPGGHTDLAAAQLASAWPVRVRAPGQAIPIPDREECGRSRLGIEERTPSPPHTPPGDTQAWCRDPNPGQWHKSTLSTTAQAAATSTWHLCHPGDRVCLACAGRPGVQGAPRYSPCHPARASARPKGRQVRD